MIGAGPKDLHDIKSVESIDISELIRAVRISIAAELDAANLYEMIAQATDDRVAKEVMQEIADEEKVHAGEFIRLLKSLSPEEIDKHHAEGAREVEGRMGSHGGPGPAGPPPQEPRSISPPGYVADIGQFESEADKLLKDLNEEMDEALAKEINENGL